MQTRTQNITAGSYDYTTRTAREETTARLLSLAGSSKNSTTAYWKKMRAYYDGDHEIRRHNAAFTGIFAT